MCFSTRPATLFPTIRRRALRIRPNIFLVSSLLLTPAFFWLLPYMIRCVRASDDMTNRRPRFHYSHHCSAHCYLDMAGCGKSGGLAHNGRHCVGLGVPRYDDISTPHRSCLVKSAKRLDRIRVAPRWLSTSLPHQPNYVFTHVDWVDSTVEGSLSDWKARIVIPRFTETHDKVLVNALTGKV